MAGYGAAPGLARKARSPWHECNAITQFVMNARGFDAIESFSRFHALVRGRPIRARLPQEQSRGAAVSAFMYRLLVVEDHDDVRAFLAEALKDAGAAATCVRTLAEGQYALDFGTYDAVIADVVLPDGDGLDLVAEASARGVKGIVISGDLPTMQHLELHNIAYFGKPFSAADILAAIRRLCGAPRG
jgi:CheY-like chemotaxis protein